MNIVKKIMFALKNIPIKQKLMLILMLTSIIVLLLACTAFIVYDFVTFRHDMVQDVSFLAKIIGENSTAALVFNDGHAAEEILASLNVIPYIVSAYICTKDGRVFARYLRRDVKGNPAPSLSQGNTYRFENKHLVLCQQIIFDGRNRIGATGTSPAWRICSYAQE